MWREECSLSTEWLLWEEEWRTKQWPHSYTSHRHPLQHCCRNSPAKIQPVAIPDKGTRQRPNDLDRVALSYIQSDNRVKALVRASEARTTNPLFFVALCPMPDHCEVLVVYLLSGRGKDHWSHIGILVFSWLGHSLSMRFHRAYNDTVIFDGLFLFSGVQVTLEDKAGYMTSK